MAKNYMTQSETVVTPVTMLEGVHRKTMVHGDKTILCRFELDKGAVLPLHSHPYEQTGYLVSGQMIFTIDGEEHKMQTGDSWCIKENVEHTVTVLEDVILVELFSPVREDFIDM